MAKHCLWAIPVLDHNSATHALRCREGNGSEYFNKENLMADSVCFITRLYIRLIDQLVIANSILLNKTYTTYYPTISATMGLFSTLLFLVKLLPSLLLRVGGFGPLGPVAGIFTTGSSIC